MILLPILLQDLPTNLMPELTEDITEEDTRVYEFCFLYPCTLSQKEESEFLKEIEKIIEETGAKQVSKDLWGKRGLAYRIKGHDEGNYVVYHYEMKPRAIIDIDTPLRITPNMLRHIVVKPPKGYEVTNFSEGFVQWLKDRENAVDEKKKEKEEKLAKRVAEKAKRQVKRVAAKKEEEVAADKPKTDKKQISDELDKLISDDDLDL